jgi:hypothetical protein
MEYSCSMADETYFYRFFRVLLVQNSYKGYSVPSTNNHLTSANKFKRTNIYISVYQSISESLKKKCFIPAPSLVYSFYIDLMIHRTQSMR